MPVPLLAVLFVGHQERALFFPKNTVAMPAAKPFKDYPDLVALLASRGMAIEDHARAVRKLTQIGYYRFTGYAYPWRITKRNANGDILYRPENPRIPQKEDTFAAGTSFNKVFSLYLLDKRLRVLMFDAIERIEIFLRAIIAHEMGRYSPLSYQEDKYINQKFRIGQNTLWDIWRQKHQQLIDDSKLDCIIWNKFNYQNNIPIWVVTEAWDFGILSKYFSLLCGKYQQKICRRIDPAVNPNILKNWFNEINILRNRCAHHARIWNQNTKNDIKFPNAPPFTAIRWSTKGKSRLFGLIVVVWHLVHALGSHSTWLQDVADCVDALPALPGCDKRIMGFPDAGQPALPQLQPALVGARPK